MTRGEIINGSKADVISIQKILPVTSNSWVTEIEEDDMTYRELLNECFFYDIKKFPEQNPTKSWEYVDLKTQKQPASILMTQSESANLTNCQGVLVQQN